MFRQIVTKFSFSVHIVKGGYSMESLGSLATVSEVSYNNVANNKLSVKDNFFNVDMFRQTYAIFSTGEIRVELMTK